MFSLCQGVTMLWSDAQQVVFVSSQMPLNRISFHGIFNSNLVIS